MSMPGGMASGLAYLPQWLAVNSDPHALETMLAAWGKASGWKVTGFAWPIETAPKTLIVARDDAAKAVPALPAEAIEVAETLRTSPTVAWQVPNGSGRLYTLFSPPGRPNGLLWAERSTPEPWTDAERNYLRLGARLIEKSSALAAKIGPLLDSERLDQRLQDASVIAGRMAHDFDNLLTGIIGFADLSVPLLPAGSQVNRFVSEIGKVGQRGIVFTQQLHQLSRSGQVKPHPGVVSAAVAKEEARLRPAMPDGLQIQADVPAGLPPVAMEAGPLQTVVGHLLENAVEASAARGLIAISARAVELSSADARAYLGQVGPGAHIELTIRDHGSGIKPDVRTKLFAEPFYTTKVRHRGLGLAIVYRVLYSHRGGVRIDVDATGPGVVARVVLPLAAARPAVTFHPATPTPSLGG